MSNRMYRASARPALVSWLLIAAVTLPLAQSADARIIHKERSLYSTILVDERGSTLCLQFSVRKDQRNQTCLDKNAPRKMVFPYAKMMMMSLLMVPEPERVLIVGLGGGTLPNVFKQLLPDTEVVSIEIDPAVVKLAKEYFDYEETDKIKTKIMDGRVFIKRAIKKQDYYDWIILDAFNGDYIPEHLLTFEFLTEVKNLLTPGGLVSANTFNSSKLYDYESVTYQKVFNELQIVKSPTKGNRVIFTCNCNNLRAQFVWNQDIAEKVKPYGVNLKQVYKRLSGKVDWKTDVPALTDQYSPANLLNQK